MDKSLYGSFCNCPHYNITAFVTELSWSLESFIFLFFSPLYPPCGACTHSSEIKSRMCVQLTQPGAPKSLKASNSLLCIWGFIFFCSGLFISNKPTYFLRRLTFGLKFFEILLKFMVSILGNKCIHCKPLKVKERACIHHFI